MTLQEILFERLAPRYERAGLEEPPFRSAPLDEALAYVRAKLTGRNGNQTQPMAPTR